MTVKHAQTSPSDLTPGSAKTLTLTVGARSPGRKSWTTVRPITLIGSRRPAHIVLHQPDVQPSHCVIVLSRDGAMLVDLGSTTGTQCNGQVCARRSIKSGDVLEVGSARIEVELSTPPDFSPSTASRASSGAVESEAAALPSLVLTEEVSGRSWRLAGAVALIGSRAGVEVELHGPLVADVQAVLFSYGEAYALFDVSSRGGLMINGWPARLGAITAGDRIQIGASLLVVSFAIAGDGPGAAGTGSPSTPGAEPPAALRGMDALSSGAGGPGGAPPAQEFGSSRSPSEPPPSSVESPITSPADDLSAMTETLNQMCDKLAALEPRLAASWRQLNDRRPAGPSSRAGGDASGANLARRVAELDAMDAALRGHLFDITRTHEQLQEFRNELERIASALASRQT